MKTFLRSAAIAAVSVGLYAVALPAQAAESGTSNKGGEVRGTARADDRAGANGDQGRDRAEANKTTKTKTPSKGKSANNPTSK